MNSTQKDQLDIEFNREKKYRKHIVIIDSSMRDMSIYQEPSYYRINLPTTYKQVTKVRLITAEIPCSFYIFNAAQNNTTLHIGIYDSSHTTRLPMQTIVLPDGNYRTDTIATTLTDLLNNNALFKSESVTFTVSVDQTTYHLSIAASNRIVYIDTAYTGVVPNPNYAINNWGLEYYLGFLPNQITKSSSSTTACTANRMIKLNPINYILLDINEINGIDECNRSTNSAFAKIPINVNSFDMITLNDNNCCSYNESNLNPNIGKLNTLTVKWRFSDASLVNFNNADHSFTLEVISIE